MRELVHTLRDQGFSLVAGVLEPAVLAQVTSLIDSALDTAKRRRSHSLRNLFSLVPELESTLATPRLLALASRLFPTAPFCTRAILFDKTKDANWKVAFHQDLTIATARQVNTPKFGPWSRKAGVPHVLAPASLLERLVTFRIHLDDADAANGALRVIPRSHRYGRLDQEAIARERSGERLCVAQAGDVLIMRPLLLHASSSGTTPARRRVIHLEFAAEELPGDLDWHQRALLPPG